MAKLWEARCVSDFMFFGETIILQKYFNKERL